MPCPCFAFCKGKDKESVVLKSKGRTLSGEGQVNPVGKNITPEETISELKSQNESLKRIANQATRDLTEAKQSYAKISASKKIFEEQFEKEKKVKQTIEKDRRELEKKIEAKDAEIRKLEEILKSVQPPEPHDNLAKAHRRQGIIVPEPENNANVKRTPKTPEQRNFLKEAILSNYFLKHLNVEQVNEMIECVQRTVHQTGVFIQEGKNGDCVYILESGELEVTQNNDLLTKLKPPAVFGELAILYNCRRTATVTAKTPTKVWKLERSVFVNIMKTTTKTRRDEMIEALQKVQLLQKLGRKQIAKIIESFDEEYFKKGDYIVRQGEFGETFYIILEGEVDVTEGGIDNQTETFIRTISKGWHFGEKALLNETGKRGANVIAKSDKVRCMTLEKKHFLLHIGDKADVDWASASVQTEKKYRPKSQVAYPKHSASSMLHLNENTVISFPKSSIVGAGRRSHMHRKSNIPPYRRERGNSTILPMPKRRMHSVFENVSLHDLEFVGVLGVGGFGRVELVTLKDKPKKSYALKCMKKIHIIETKQEEHIYSEKKIMRDSDCPFIVQLYRTFKNDRYVYMLMEACLGGELWAKLRDDGYFDESRSRFYAACVIEALDYLHLRGIVYRDLKPENLLLDARGYVKIVDFGFAKSIQHGEKTWTFCGTPEYVAPEVILNKGHDIAVDYWALGILIYEMLTGNPPFNSSDAMKTYRMALRGIDAIEWPQKISKPAQNLIRRLCRENPAERIGNLNDGVTGIRNHRWFSGFDWKALQNASYNVPYIPEINGPVDLRNFDQFDREDETVEKETSGWDRDF